MDGRNGKTRSPVRDGPTGQERGSPDEEEPEITGRKIQSDAEITKRRDSVPSVWNG